MMWERVLFDGWSGVLRTAVIAVLIYIVLLVLLRVSGKRTLSKMNAFDFVVTVALGSTLATVLLNHEVSLVEGATAFAMLVGLQFAVTWTSVRITWVRNVVTGEPTLLAYRGRPNEEALRRTRVTHDELRSALRTQGLHGLEDADAVVLETDGSFSVIRRGPSPDIPALKDVRGTPDAANPGESP